MNSDNWNCDSASFKMSNEGEKIKFSFSKVKKPALLKKIDTEPKEKIDYVDCFDGSKGKFSYKGNIRHDEIVKQELVIPMPSTKTSLDILKSRIEEKEKKNLEISETNKIEIKDSEDNNKTNQNLPKNLEELATLEILNDIKNDEVNNKEPSRLIIEAKDVPPEASEHDIDYENVPVTEFGLALLRGMGWRPDEGIGKEPRIIEAQSPVLRPKGLGLGAKLNNEVKDDEKNTKKSKDSNSSSISQKHKSKAKEYQNKNKSEIYKK